MYSLAEYNLIEPYLTKKVKVLEYGSGESSIEIAKMVNTLLTIEHNRDWMDKIKPQLPDNALMLFAPPTCLEWGTDGTYEQFKEYIEAPEDYGVFDVIIIDGRARIGCAEYCKHVSHKNTTIFVHDYNRLEYKEIETHLILIKRVGSMAQFKI